MSRYALGVDYGTLSARAILIEITTGEIAGNGVCDYPHGIYDAVFVDESPLPSGFALQDPSDYFGKGANDVMKRLNEMRK